MSKNDYYVYAYIRGKDTETAKKHTPYYIGKGRGRRAWAKNHRIMPKEKNRIRIIQEGLSESEAHELEITLIRWYGRVDQGTGILRNLTNGGEGTSNPDKETREKIRIANLGNKNSLGHKLTEEAREKLRNIKIGNKHARGYKHTEEAREKLRGNQRARGHKLTEEAREKLRNANIGNKKGLGYKHTEEARKKMSEASKKMHMKRKAAAAAAALGASLTSFFEEPSI